MIDSEKVDSARVQIRLEDMVTKLKEEMEGLLTEVRESGESLARGAAAPQQEETLIMLSTKMQLQSEIEAMKETSVVQLPDDNQLLMMLAKEEAEIMAITNARTLAIYRQKVLKLQEVKKIKDEMLKKATLVNNKMDQLLDGRSEKDQLAFVKKRFDRTAVSFRAQRHELHFILSEFYPEDGDKMSMEALLEKLVTKMLDDQNDPYIDIDETMKTDHVEFLVRANLVMRHHKNITQIRFFDPRA